MSDLEVGLTQQQMEESGEMDFIRAHVAAAAGEDAPAPVADTVDDEIQNEELQGTPEVEDSAEEGVSADDGIEEDAESASDDDVMYLDLDEETERLLNEKYNGDLSAMLKAAREGQSVIGRQGNELGAVRAELQALRQQLEQGLAASQPYPEWPDEYAEPNEAAAQLQVIAEQAFERRDPETFNAALAAWNEQEPLSARLYAQMKAQEVRAMESVPQAVENDATLADGIAALGATYPQLNSESFQAEVAAELDKTPSLKAVLWGEVPGVSQEERLTIFTEAVQRVASRQTDETAQQARKRIAVRTSEEARAARVAAQVVRGGTARGAEPEVEARTVPMGESGRTLNLDRLNALLPPEDRI